MCDFEPLIYFKNTVPDDIFYLFDFSENKWIETKIISQYPYNLYKFVLNNGKEEINCINSYRIKKSLENIPSNEEMNKLRIAHEKLLTEKIIYSKLNDYTSKKNLYLKEEDIYYTSNIHLKSDIIPGVICAFNEYHYYEDTFFIIDVSEKIKEKNLKYLNELSKERDEENKKIDEIINNIPIIKEFENKNIGKIKDIRPYWKTLMFLSEEITYNTIVKANKGIKINEEEFNDYCKESIITKALCGLVAYNDKYDWVYTNQNENIDKKYVDLKYFDGFFDIKIIDATYAYLSYCDTDLNLEKVDNYFTFTDITQENPLFSLVGEVLRIYTDGKSISYNGLLLDTFPKKIINTHFQKYNIGLFPSHNKILLFGHLGSGSTIIDIDFE